VVPPRYPNQPRTASYWFNIGIAYDRLGQRSQALAAYERARDLDPANGSYIAASRAM
jgi:Flp pilus assembly protein TadD